MLFYCKLHFYTHIRRKQRVKYGERADDEVRRRLAEDPDSKQRRKRGHLEPSGNGWKESEDNACAMYIFECMCVYAFYFLPAI